MSNLEAPIYVSSHNAAIEPPVLRLMPANMSGKRVLDVGTGEGYWGYVLRARMDGRPYIVGVEPEKLYYDCAIRGGAYDEAHLETGLEYLDRHEGTFDVELLLDVIEHHRTKEEAWRLADGLRGRLNPGGVLVITTTDGHSPGAPGEGALQEHPISFRAAEFRERGFETKLVKRSGFSLGHVVGPVAYAWWAMRWRRRPAFDMIVAWAREKV